MKSEEQILNKLAELKSDSRLTQPSASIQINAPLALIQLELESNIGALEWVLDLPRSTFPLPKKK